MEIDKTEFLCSSRLRRPECGKITLVQKKDNGYHDSLIQHLSGDSAVACYLKRHLPFLKRASGKHSRSMLSFDTSSASWQSDKRICCDSASGRGGCTIVREQGKV